MRLTLKSNYYRHHTLIDFDVLRKAGDAQAIARPFLGLSIGDASQCTTPMQTLTICGQNALKSSVKVAADHWAWRCEGMEMLEAFYHEMAENTDPATRNIAERMKGRGLDLWAGMLVRAARYFNVTPKNAESIRLADVMLMDKAAYLDYLIAQMRQKMNSK